MNAVEQPSVTDMLTFAFIQAFGVKETTHEK